MKGLEPSSSPEQERPHPGLQEEEQNRRRHLIPAGRRRKRDGSSSWHRESLIPKDYRM